MLSRSYNEDASESDKSGLFTDAFVKVLETSSEPLTVFQIHERVLHGMPCEALNCTYTVTHVMFCVNILAEQWCR